MSDSRRVYLDNAATSFPKPDAVHKAVLHYLRDLGNAVGRGATKTGIEVQRTVDQCRLRAARLFDVPRPEQVIFTFNGTDSLNLAIHGLLKPGDVALTTVWDHNSVLRPLSHFAATGGHTVIIGDDGRGQLDIQQLERELQVRSVRLVCVTHASNVTGIIQPIEEVIRLAHEHGALVLLDAAQTAGHLPMSFSKLNVDLLACPGHKGLLGPLGTGLLILRKDLAEELVPIRQGGTGTTSEQATQPTTLPDRFEAGNHNAPGLFGLEAALKWIDEKGVAKIQLQEEQLAIPLIAGLRSFQGLTVHSFPPRPSLKSRNATICEYRA